MQNAPLEHSAVFLTCIKLPYGFKTFVLSILEWPLKTGFTVSKCVGHSYKIQNTRLSKEQVTNSRTIMMYYKIRQNLLPCSQFEAGTVTLVMVVTWCAGILGGFSGATKSGLAGGSINSQRVFSGVDCTVLSFSL